MRKLSITGLFLAVVLATGALAPGPLQADKDPVVTSATTRILDGRQTFRFDTFADEAFWGSQLQLQNAIKGAAFGGVGPGLTPAAALELGLKVDVAALPKKVIADIKNNQVNLNDVAVTLQLLQLNAVVGLTGFFDAQKNLTSVGIQCALCHSQVDNSLVPGIGNRLDGWANRDLNVGAITALAPNLQPFIDLLSVVTPNITDAQVRAVLNGWGPGKFDAELILDGKTVNPFTQGSSATLIPPAFGLSGVNLHTWTGWGSVTHWNAFVANLEMHGKGIFFDPRLADPVKFPIAATFGFGNVRNSQDLITPKLGDLHFFQLALISPPPPAGSFDAAAAARGQVLFNGKADCARCHVPPLYTEPGWNMHLPADIGIDAFQANRAPDGRYRTSPLKGLWTHRPFLKEVPPGPFYHDGRFATLLDVVNHYNTFFGLGLTEEEKADLVQFLLSL